MFYSWFKVLGNLYPQIDKAAHTKQRENHHAILVNTEIS